MMAMTKVRKWPYIEHQMPSYQRTDNPVNTILEDFNFLVPIWIRLMHAGFDPRAEAIAEWREMSQLVYKIGREQEAFTEISANMMKRTVDGVQRMDPEGVKKAKAAMHRMFTCFQQAVKA